MAIEEQVVGYEGGALRRLASGEKSREAVLALPLNRLLLKLVRVPADADAVETAAPILKGMCPFPDDQLTISCEMVCEDAESKVVIAAALPESAADDIGAALDAEKLNITRVDALVLGTLRGIWNALGELKGRRLILVRSVDCLSLIVLDGELPVAIRALSDATDLKRELMLSLLEAEDFGGASKLEEIVVVFSESAEVPEDSESNAGVAESLAVNQDDLAAFAPVRMIQVGADAALVGVAERSAADSGALNALPDSWREVLIETRFKAKLFKYLAVAGSLWVLIMAVLFGVPIGYGFMTDHQKGLSKQHARQYNAVKEMKAKVDLIHKYSDHARSALEIMKAVSDRLPEGITLSSWDYKRDDGVRVKGEADSAEATYAFKDAIDAMAEGEEGDGEPIFNTVNLVGPNASKNKYNFNLDCQYKKEEAE